MEGGCVWQTCNEGLAYVEHKFEWEIVQWVFQEGLILQPIAPSGAIKLKTWFQLILHYWCKSWYVLSFLWDGAYKRTLAANHKT